MNVPGFSAPRAYRLRLIIGFTLVIAVLVGAWAWSLYAPLSGAVLSQQKYQLENVARAGAVALSASGDEQFAAILGRVAGSSAIRLTLVAADGTVLADTEEEAGTLANHGGRPEIRSALGGTTGSDVRLSGTQGIERVYVAVPLTLSGSPAALRASEPVARVASLSADARRTSLLVLLGIALVVAVAALVLSRAAARPVEMLVEAAGTMAAGDLTQPVPQDTGALQPLSHALANVREQLRERLSALETEQATLRTALDGLADGVLLLDDDRVELANRALPLMFRTPHGRLDGLTVAEVGLPAPVESAIIAHRDAETPVTVELGPDPFQRYHRMLVIPLGEAEVGSRTLVVIADVTDRMRLDVVRRDFVANASHELKTPTAGILLLAEMAEQAAADGNDAQAASFVTQISAEALRLRKLVADLLDLSRAENAPSTGEIADVRRAVDLALSGHRRAAAVKGLELVADLHAINGADVAVRCSTTDLAIALDNLLANAITYTDAGTVIVRVSADAGTVRVDVSDTGIGIPESDLERVFERFYRVDRARSRESGGTGLGLSLVRNVTEHAGGSVQIRSALAKGTTVTLLLPRAV